MEWSRRFTDINQLNRLKENTYFEVENIIVTCKLKKIQAKYRTAFDHSSSSSSYSSYCHYDIIVLLNVIFYFIRGFSKGF